MIDTTIIKNADGYYRYSKDETTKNIRVDFSKTLDAGSFTDMIPRYWIRYSEWKVPKYSNSTTGKSIGLLVR